MSSYLSVSKKISDRVVKPKKSGQRRKNQASTFSRMKGLYDNKKTKKQREGVRNDLKKDDLVYCVQIGKGKEEKKVKIRDKRNTVDSETVSVFRQTTQNKKQFSYHLQKQLFDSFNSDLSDESGISNREGEKGCNGRLFKHTYIDQKGVVTNTKDESNSYNKSKDSIKPFLNGQSMLPYNEENEIKKEFISNKHKVYYKEEPVSDSLAEYEELAQLMEDNTYIAEQKRHRGQKLRIHVNQKRVKGQRIQNSLLNYSYGLQTKTSKYTFEGKKACFKKTDMFPQLSISERAIEVVSVLSKKKIQNKFDNRTETTLKTRLTQTPSINHIKSQRKVSQEEKISLFNSNGSTNDKISFNEELVEDKVSRPINDKNNLKKDHQFLRFSILSRKTYNHQQKTVLPVSKQQLHNQHYDNSKKSMFVILSYPKHKDTLLSPSLSKNLTLDHLIDLNSIGNRFNTPKGNYIELTSFTLT